MSIENIKKRLQQESVKDTQWLKRAQWRKENQDWLDISFEIAVKIGAALSKNKKTGTYPKSQKELAEAMGVSPQYINKVLKGSENLQLETITKIQNILGVALIHVPKEEVKFTSSVKLPPVNFEFLFKTNVEFKNLVTKEAKKISNQNKKSSSAKSKEKNYLKVA